MTDICGLLTIGVSYLNVRAIIQQRACMMYITQAMFGRMVPDLRLILGHLKM